VDIENRKKELIIKYGQIKGMKVFEHKNWLGMTKEMLIESWGTPEDINRTVTRYGVTEQCIYSNTYV
jgi:hypothetical protein